VTIRRILMCVLLAAGAPVAWGQVQSIVDSPHNLSATGPGAVRALTEEQLCIFCHTPHRAAPIQPLWNRYLPVDAYSVYTSNALDATPGQPTGASKLCLSCHDGTIAVGSVVSRATTIQMAGGITTLPPGASNLGTDLSDDHPISFQYDSLLAVNDPKLLDPGLLPPELPLDSAHEFQCTTCHDAHNNWHGHFLKMSNADSMMCRSCHLLSATTVTPHEDCVNCHQAHTAPSGPYLLVGDRVTTTCLTCHDGSYTGAADILTDLGMFSVHDTGSPVDPPDPIPGHVRCADCHEPHTMMPGSARPPSVHPNFGQISGVNSSGAPVESVGSEFAVCYKCHADRNAFRSEWVSRIITQINTRLEFDPSSVSFHPVEAPGRNRDVPSLQPPWTTASLMHCSDCHGSSMSVKAGGSGPNGPHGSNEEPLLLARYETADFTPESADAYALCYRCHFRDTNDGILLDRSFTQHKLHVEGANAPCSVCHDAHGISSAQGTFRNNSHLINFDRTIVFPDPLTGRREFIDDGLFMGQCYLRCHGVDHSPKSY
jgi:predicted CXXCH cytochrome family protein